MAGMFGTVVLASPSWAAPAADRLDPPAEANASATRTMATRAVATALATGDTTVAANPLPDPAVSTAANLQPLPAIVAPESSLEVTVPEASPPRDGTAQLATAFDQSVVEPPSETADAEADFWPTPADLPPPEPIAPAVRTAPLGIPTANSTPPPPAATSIDDELGSLTIQPIPANDEDFGQLPTRLLPPPPPKPKWLFVGAQIGYFGNSNAFSTTTKQADGLIRTGLTVTALPMLGPKTYFLGGIDGNIVRYGKYSQLNYDELRLRAGILQQLSPRMFGEIGWSNQKLYAAQDGLRSILSGSRLNENSLRLELSRTDPITPNLSVSSFYQLRWSASSRPQGDRVSNTIYTALNYKLSPSWTAGLDYQMSWSHYTQVARDELFQQVQLRTRYALTPSLSMNLFGGFSFGGSSDRRKQFGLNTSDRLQYDGWSFGVTFAYAKGLF
jgi:hypothetical protein